MTIEEISVKFTADTNELKKALSDITETLKGTEAQTMDIASALDEITQPIKDMSKDLRTLTEQSAAYNKQMSEVTKTVSGTGKAVGEINSKMQTVSKQSTAETAKITTGWKKVKETMQDVFNSRPTANWGGNTNNGGETRSYKVSRNPSDATQEKAQKALDAEQAKLQKLQNTLNGYRIKLDAVNQKYDIQNQKVQKTSNDIQVQQTKLDGLKRDYEAMSSVMSELNIDDSINAEMVRLKTTLDENKISANELFNAMERLKQSPYDIIDVGNSFMSMEDMTKKMNELDTSSEQAWGRLEKLETAMGGVSAESRNFGSMQGLQRMNSIITQQENKLRSLQNAYSTASTQSASLSGKQEMLQANMQQTRDSIQQAQERISQLSAALQNTSQNTSTGFFGRLASTVKNVGNATASLIHRFQNGVSHIKNFGTVAGSAGRRLFSLYENTTLIGRGLSSLKDKLSGLSSKFVQTSRMVKSMVLSMLFMQLMSGMGETLQSFAKQSVVVNNDLSLLASSFTYLKSSILSAFQPLLSYITPILTSIVNTVADAFNKLAEFFAYLTGQTTFEKAVYTQKDYSASLDQSAASAKELQNVLLGFDQITKLDDNSGSSGSGSSGNGLNTGNWETTKVIKQPCGFHQERQLGSCWKGSWRQDKQCFRIN
jgi:predicted  nucleic acid-binding Zn-ribbon protein